MVSFIIIAVANKILWRGGGIRSPPPPQLYVGPKKPSLNRVKGIPASGTKLTYLQSLQQRRTKMYITHLLFFVELKRLNNILPPATLTLPSYIMDEITCSLQ